MEETETSVGRGQKGPPRWSGGGADFVGLGPGGVDLFRVATLADATCPPAGRHPPAAQGKATTASTSNSIGSIASLGTGTNVVAGNAAPNIAVTAPVSTPNLPIS